MSHASKEGHASHAVPNSAAQVLHLTGRKPGTPRDLGKVPALLWGPDSLLRTEQAHSCPDVY